MVAINVIEGKKPSSPVLLAVICAGIRYLVRDPLILDKPLIQPLPFTGYNPLKESSDCRVFCKDKKVVKIYDTHTENYFLPNAELLNLCGVTASMTNFIFQGVL